MSLHGHTKIELTDVRTGKTETVAHDNFIAGGVAEYYRPMGSVLTGWELLTDARIADMFGSVLLFDSAIEGDGTTLFPAGGNKCLGGADYGVINSAGEDWRGNCNTNESKIDALNHVATFVYDFATDQCNGVIGAVCCAPQYSAQSAIFGTEGTKFESIAPRTRKSMNEQRQNWRMATDQFDYSTRRLRALRMDFDEDTLWLLDITTPGSCTLEKHWAPCCHTSLFHTAQGGYTRQLQSVSVALPQSDMAVHWRGAELTDTGRLYLFAYRKSENAGGNPLYFMEVDAATGKVEKTLTLENKLTYAGSKVAPSQVVPIVAEGSIYLMYTNTTPIYQIPLDNPTDVRELDTKLCTSAFIYPVLKIPGRVYLQLGGGYYPERYAPCVLYTADGTIRRSDAYISYPSANTCGEGTQAVPVKGYPLCRGQLPNVSYAQYDSYLYKLRMFLSTINNLATPVQKTSDKTMKITYTIQETTA